MISFTAFSSESSTILSIISTLGFDESEVPNVWLSRDFFVAFAIFDWPIRATSLRSISHRVLVWDCWNLATRGACISDMVHSWSHLILSAQAWLNRFGFLSFPNSFWYLSVSSSSTSLVFLLRGLRVLLCDSIANKLTRWYSTFYTEGQSRYISTANI